MPSQYNASNVINKFAQGQSKAYGAVTTHFIRGSTKGMNKAQSAASKMATTDKIVQGAYVLTNSDF